MRNTNPVINVMVGNNWITLYLDEDTAIKFLCGYLYGTLDDVIILKEVDGDVRILNKSAINAIHIYEDDYRVVKACVDSIDIK